MAFNLIIIPLVIILTAWQRRQLVNRVLPGWYATLKKPWWLPRDLVDSLWAFLYIITLLAILWFWNVPVFTQWHYVVSAVLLFNAYMNVRWHKTFFVDQNLERSYKESIVLFGSAAIAALMIAPYSYITFFLFTPYLVWLGITAYVSKRIMELNK
ncbi:MAG: tryptophan-rich sensory protein [bacterium]|nr:tryptophan-rich sensory protein [bacterium]